MPCAAAGRRVCRPLPVLSPNVAIFFNDVAPPRRLGEGYYTCSQMVGNGEVPKARRPGLPYPLCGARTHRGIAAPCASKAFGLVDSWFGDGKLGTETETSGSKGGGGGGGFSVQVRCARAGPLGFLSVRRDVRRCNAAAGYVFLHETARYPWLTTGRSSSVSSLFCQGLVRMGWRSLQSHPIRLLGWAHAGWSLDLESLMVVPGARY